ncbi:hypothetical protein QBC39DRAFT_26692 [Podospora conica]|nr:hypothetical protein QBC39DRAFT_26692 [Schizothecium conicum]
MQIQSRHLPGCNSFKAKSNPAIQTRFSVQHGTFSSPWLMNRHHPGHGIFHSTAASEQDSLDEGCIATTVSTLREGTQISAARASLQLQGLEPSNTMRSESKPIWAFRDATDTRHMLSSSGQHSRPFPNQDLPSHHHSGHQMSSSPHTHKTWKGPKYAKALFPGTAAHLSSGCTRPAATNLLAASHQRFQCRWMLPHTPIVRLPDISNPWLG